MEDVYEISCSLEKISYSKKDKILKTKIGKKIVTLTENYEIKKINNNVRTKSRNDYININNFKINEESKENFNGENNDRNNNIEINEEINEENDNIEINEKNNEENDNINIEINEK